MIVKSIHKKYKYFFPRIHKFYCGVGVMDLPKVRFGVGGILMISALLISDSGELILIYALAAALHEAGHLLAAKLLKIGVSEIAFGFSGIRIVTDGRLTSYKKEAILAAAGPIVNAVCFLCSLAAFLSWGEGLSAMLAEGGEALSFGLARGKSALAFFALSSLLQSMVNLLPIKSFDGGRIFYCALAEHFGEGVAERGIGISTALSAFVLWTVALYLMLRVSGGLGIFVFAACVFAGGILKNDELK